MGTGLRSHRESRVIASELPLQAVVAATALSVRRARRWAALTAILAALLAVWEAAPGFDVVPGAFAFVLRIVGFVVYGPVPPSGSFIGQAARSANLGYAALYGPAVLLIMATAWAAREAEAAKLLRPLVAHPRLRLGAGTFGRGYGRAAAAVAQLLVVFWAQLALVDRSFDLLGSPQELRGERRDDPECFVRGRADMARFQSREGSVLYVKPWPNSEDWLTWLSTPIDRWCIRPSRGESPWELHGFRSTLEDTFFEEQLRDAELQRRRAAELRRLGDVAGALAAEFLSDLPPEQDGGAPQGPFRYFPYVYPRLVATAAFLVPLLTLVCAVVVARSRATIGPRIPEAFGAAE